MILPDNSFWIPLLTTAHQFNQAAGAWMNKIPAEERVVFCAVTQLSVLRLLTTEKVMGTEVMTQQEAWRAYDDLRIDPRIDLVDEPDDIQMYFRQFSYRDQISPKRWTDDYIIGFAKAAQITIVTFDRNMAARAENSILLS